MVATVLFCIYFYAHKPLISKFFNHFSDPRLWLPLTLVVVSILFCLTVIGLVFAISQTDFYIKNIGTATTQDGKLTNTINVTGVGKVFAVPDMVSVQLSICETKPTSSEALEGVNSKVTKI